MDLLTYARERIRSVLEQIDQLDESEFPYPHSQAVLGIIRDLFLSISAGLDGLDEKSDPPMVKSRCGLSLRALFRYLPRLGFILRSTNVRNAFEVFGPLLRIAQEVLEPGVEKEDRTTKLLLSSEWNYSPLTYPQAADLPGVVFIGFPAPESANPMLMPLAGHELGHAIWSKEKLDHRFKPDVKNSVLNYIKSHWTDYQATFPYVSKKEDLTTDMFAQQTWAPALNLSLKHAQETFCDFVGLRIFGQAYLHAYAYLLAPNVSSPRSAYYPNAMKRVDNLIRAARCDRYKVEVRNDKGDLVEEIPDAYKDLLVEVPNGYRDLFHDRPESNVGQADRYRLKVADGVLDDMFDTLAIKTDELIRSTGIQLPDAGQAQEIYGRFKKVVPANGCRCLADILNAAWIAFWDRRLWEDIPRIVPEMSVILRELVLKNIEIFEVEQIRKDKR